MEPLPSSCQGYRTAGSKPNRVSFRCTRLVRTSPINIQDRSYGKELASATSDKVVAVVSIVETE